MEARKRVPRKEVEKFARDLLKNSRGLGDVMASPKEGREHGYRGIFPKAYKDIDTLMQKHVRGTGLVYAEAGLGSWGHDEQGVFTIIRRHHPKFRKFLLYDHSDYPVEKAKHSIEKLPAGVRKKVLVDRASGFTVTPIEKPDVTVTAHVVHKMPLADRQEFLEMLVETAKSGSYVFMDLGTSYVGFKNKAQLEHVESLGDIVLYRKKSL